MAIFRGINYFGQLTTRSLIRENVVAALSQAMIDAGGYYNFATGVIGYDGQDFSQLRPSYRPEYANFRFWAGSSSNWVWETQNATYAGGVSPIIPSGIFVSGSFYPQKDGSIYDHYIDYARGGIVFTNAQPSGLNVYCPRSERAGFVYSSTSSEYRKIFNAHLRNWKGSPPGSGYDEMPQEIKAFLPAIFVDIKRADGIPYELGSSVRMDKYAISFDVIAEDMIHFDFLMDCCTSLQSNTIRGYDANTIYSSGLYGLNYDGTLNANRLSLSQRADSCFWKNLRFTEDATEMDSFIALPLIRGGIAVDLEIFV